MCYSVLEELTKVRTCESSRNVKLPKPYYLFVQKYGRNMEAEMPEIAKTVGNGRWFSFAAEVKKKDVTMTSHFLMELEKYAEIGKPFQGCVLMELTGEEDPKELYELLNFIRQKAQQFSCIFSTRTLENAEEIKNSLEQHFFVRRIDGKKYESAEQSALFLKVLSEYGFGVDELSNRLDTLFAGVHWDEEDMVQNRIENLAQNLVYEKMLQPEGALEVSMAEVEKATDELKKEPEKVRCIGFVRGE